MAEPGLQTPQDQAGASLLLRAHPWPAFSSTPSTSPTSLLMRDSPSHALLLDAPPETFRYVNNWMGVSYYALNATSINTFNIFHMFELFVFPILWTVYSQAFKYCPMCACYVTLLFQNAPHYLGLFLHMLTEIRLSNSPIKSCWDCSACIDKVGWIHKPYDAGSSS